MHADFLHFCNFNRGLIFREKCKNEIFVEKTSTVYQNSVVVLEVKSPKLVSFMFQRLRYKLELPVCIIARQNNLSSNRYALFKSTGKQIMHDPFAMRPFSGYNFGDYLKHWLTLGKKENAKLPKIFRVKLPKIFHIKLPKIFHANNGLLWPGFGEDIAKRTAIILCPSSSR